MQQDMGLSSMSTLASQLCPAQLFTLQAIAGLPRPPVSSDRPLTGAEQAVCLQSECESAWQLQHLWSAVLILGGVWAQHMQNTAGKH